MIRATLITTVLATACTASPPSPSLAVATQPMSVCADGPTTYGIDVSRFQGDIDWNAVAGSGVKFAYIQISRSLTDLDAKFAYNWKRAKEVGLLRGAYQRFHPGQDVIGQANVFLDKLGPYQVGDLPPMLDVEDADGLSGPQIAAAVKQWMDYVEPRVGRKPLIYTGFYFWRDSVGGADFSDHPLWIANYSATCPLVPPAWTRWAFHQYSSSAMIPGITANTVDVNKFNGTLDDLKALADPPAEPPACDDEIAATGGIVDDGSTCFQAGGNPAFIREENAGFGSSLKWTHATDAATAANFGRWNLSFARAGRYRVEAYTPAPYNGSMQAVYEVQHGDTLDPVSVDQSAVDGWNLIGDFDFVAGGDGQYIRVADNTGEPESSETKIVFDALRFTPLDSSGNVDDPDGDGMAAAGCSSTFAPSWCLAAALLFVRRRRTRRAR